MVLRRCQTAVTDFLGGCIRTITHLQIFPSPSLLEQQHQIQESRHQCNLLTFASLLAFPCRSLDSRMTQEVLRKHVLRVLRVWREHYLFNDDYLNGLQVGLSKIGSVDESVALRSWLFACLD